MATWKGLAAAALLSALALVAAAARAEPLQSREFIANVQFDAPDAAPGDGICRIATNPQLPAYCTLRAAVMEANAQPLLVDVRITLVPGGVYELTIPGRDESSAKTGDLDVMRPMRIATPGGTATAKIDANGHDRVFSIAADGVVTLSGMEIVGGARMTGSAVAAWSGSLVMDACDVHHNASTDEGGSASVVAALSMSSVQIIRSRLHHNGVPNQNMSVVHTGGENISIERSLIDSNNGMAVYHAFGSKLIVRSSTISGNSGAGFSLHQPTEIEHTTIADNAGGQLHFDGAKASLRLVNSIVSGAGPNCSDSEQAAALTARYNIYSGSGCVSDIQVDHSLYNTDPRLYPLANWGGPTLTRKPMPNSPAIDHSPALLCDEDPLDQRGFPRPRAYTNNAEPRCDVGAVELPQAPIFVDPNDPPAVPDPFESGFTSGFESG